MYRTLAITTLVALAVLGLYATLNTSFFPRRISDMVPHRPIADVNPYRAPLLNSDVPMSEKVAGSFGVFLYPGCSLEAHKSTVKEIVDLDAHIQKIFDVELPGQVWYHARNISDVALDAIRGDTSVALVECTTLIHMID